VSALRENDYTGLGLFLEGRADGSGPGFFAYWGLEAEELACGLLDGDCLGEEAVQVGLELHLETLPVLQRGFWRAEGAELNAEFCG
jgi:hypothetical protein